MTFDLEKARAVCKTLPKYMNGACPCKEEAEAAKMLIKALPEIERLRAALDESEKVAAHKSKSADHWYQECLQKGDDLLQSKRTVEQMATRIQELGEALAEYQRLGKTIAGKVPDADECPDDLPPIGSPYRSWEVTEERKEALDRVLNYMDYMYPKSSPYYHCALDVSVLRSMLTEAEQ